MSKLKCFYKTIGNANFYGTWNIGEQCDKSLSDQTFLPYTLFYFQLNG